MFDDEELERMATPTSIVLERVADRSDAGGIDAAIRRMNDEHLAIYDAYIQWLGVLQSHLVETGGEETHRDALEYATEKALPRFVEDYRGKSYRERVETLASRLRAGGSTFDVTETGDRVTFTLDPWGPSRLWRQPQAWLEERARNRDGDRYEYPCYGLFDEPTSLATLSKSRDVTGGRSDVPCYLATEVITLERKPIELLGYPLAVIDFLDGVDGETHLHVHKDPSDVPESVYERTGTTKPTTGITDNPDEQVFEASELERLGQPLSIQAELADEEGDEERLRELAGRYDDELVRTKDQLGLVIGALLTWIARHQGEDVVESVLKRTADVVMTPFIDVIRPMDRKEQIAMWAMVFRAHGSTYCDGPKPGIEEYDDRVVFRGRPLGACGRMWASGYQDEIERISENRVRYPTFGCYDPPMNFHMLREPRGITHMKEEYPIYSSHCHTLHEVFCTGQFGHPLWVEEHPINDRDGVTRHVHYKDPGDWPEEYYEQIGHEKPDTLPEDSP